MKKIFIFLFMLFFLVSCWDENNDLSDETPKKKEFFIETIKVDELPKQTTIEKIWKISSIQNIILNSNASWRVSSIFVKPWDKVRLWQNLIILEDNLWNYGINLAKASNALEESKINYDSSKINLDKEVFDAEINLEKLKKNLEALKKETKQNIKKAEDDLKNSKSVLTLEKLYNNIEKLKLDYDNKIISDNETIEWFKSNLKKDYDSLLIFLNDIIEFSDKLLWVTKKNEDEDDIIEDYLWWKNKIQKWFSEDYLLELIYYRKSSEFIDLWNKLKQNSLAKDSEISNALDVVDSWYEKIKVLLNSLEETLNNSIESIWILWSADISSYIATVNSYQSNLQVNSSSFITFRTSVNSFLRTYEKSQESLLKQIGLLEKDVDILEKSLSSWELWAEVSLEKILINTDNAINDLETQIQIAENDLKNTKKTRDVTLRVLNNSIKQAEINYKQASINYSKLTIKSPINWTVSNIFVDKWQEVSVWTKTVNIVWNSNPEVEVSFKKEDLYFIKQWQEVFLNYDNKSLNWIINSISSVADINLNYKAQIVFSDKVDLIWDLVVVSIPLKLEKPLLPINLVEISWNWRWFLNIYKDNKIVNKEVELGLIYDDKIELNTILDDDIIINDISNFDENKFELMLKN